MPKHSSGKQIYNLLFLKGLIGNLKKQERKNKRKLGIVSLTGNRIPKMGKISVSIWEGKEQR